MYVARRTVTTVAGLLAKPLYACTCTRADGNICMALAAMSPLLEQKVPHKHFVCGKCRNNATSLPAFGSAPRRVLRLYLLVHKPAGRSTVLRSGSMDALVEPPQADFQWGVQPANRVPSLRKAMPTCTSGAESRNIVYKFDDKESRAIWAEAQTFNLATECFRRAP